MVTPHRVAWHGKLAVFAAFTALRVLSSSWRLRVTDRTGDLKGPVIFSIWHNRLALCTKGYRRVVMKRWPAPGLAALVSASKDGALLAEALRHLDIQAVRGSSSRRGRQALLELTTLIQEGFNAAITPDGPKGPKYKAQEGIIALAQVTGSAIIPVSAQVDRKWALRSWDAFQIPKPFAVCEVCLNRPIWVPREADENEREALRAELERRMMEFTFD